VGSEDSARFDDGGDRARNTTGYYEKSRLEDALWRRAVPAYFVVGGAAGGAALVAAAAQATGAQRLEGLIGRCRVAAVGGAVAGTVWLVYDLGRPQRFLNEFSSFRHTSDMSSSPWVLAASAASDITALTLSRSDGGWRRLGLAAGAAAGALGLPLAGYTGALSSDTPVPLWRAMRRTLPPLFLISGISSALALVNLGSLTNHERRVISRLGRVLDIAELVVTVAAEREAKQVAEVGAALEEGPGARMWKLSTSLTVGTLAMSLLPAGSRAVRTLQAAMGLAGSWALRAGVFEAGLTSARESRGQQKSQLKEFERS
jgi:formate-dependent nitrite reductase membrane component NrfD